MTWILTAASIAGVILNIWQNEYCFLIWIFTNATWAIIDFKKKIPAQGVLFTLYFILAIWGFFQWRIR